MGPSGSSECDARLIGRPRRQPLEGELGQGAGLLLDGDRQPTDRGDRVTFGDDQLDGFP